MPSTFTTPDAIATQVAQWRPFPPPLYEALSIRWPAPDAAPRLAAIVDASPELSRRLPLMGTHTPANGETFREVIQAIDRAGCRPVQAGIVASLVIDTLAATSNTIDFLAYWHRAAACATLAAALADREDIEGHELAYPAGLLHQVGLLAVDMSEPQALRALCSAIADEGWSEALEQAVLGFTVREVTAALHVRWRLPVDLAEAHLLSQPDAWERRPVARVLHQAVEAIDAIGIEDPLRGVSPLAALSPTVEDALDHLGGSAGLITHAERVISTCLLASEPEDTLLLHAVNEGSLDDELDELDAKLNPGGASFSD